MKSIELAYRRFERLSVICNIRGGLREKYKFMIATKAEIEGIIKKRKAL